MNVNVQLFAGASQIAGVDEVSVELPAGATFADLSAALSAAEPNLTSLVASSRFAADAEYVAADAKVDLSAEIALIPPVSGG